MDRGCGLVASEQMPSEQKNKGSDHRESEKIRNHGGQERDTITTLGAYRSCLQQLLLHRCHLIDSFPHAASNPFSVRKTIRSSKIFSLFAMKVFKAARWVC
jgi:hypothetical protein